MGKGESNFLVAEPPIVTVRLIHTLLLKIIRAINSKQPGTLI